jgi:hypothetical protein
MISTTMVTRVRDTRGTGVKGRAPNRKPRWRAAAKLELKAKGVIPCRRQWIYSIEPQALEELPQWAIDSSIKGLAHTSRRVWLWDKDSKRLIGLDRAAGGRPRVTRTELRTCPLCARPLVGIEAERRRKLDQSGPDGRKQPCGVDCARDRESRVWKKLSKRRQA